MVTHQIQHLLIEANASNKQQLLEQQQQIHYWVQTASFERMLESLFNEMAGEDEYLQIDFLELEIDIRQVDQRNFEECFRQALKTKLLYKIAQKQKMPNGVKKQAVQESVQAAILYFLQKGNIPWFADATIRKQVEARIKELPLAEDKQLLAAIIREGLVQPIIFKRLILLLGIEGVRLLLTKEAYIDSAFLGEIKELQERVIAEQPAVARQAALERQIWQEVWLLIASKKPKSAWLGEVKQAITLFMSTTELDKSSKPFISSEGLEAPTKALQPQGEEASGLFIENAGLVLLWGLYGGLFRQLQWVKNSQFIDEDSQQRALLLLHYLATAKTNGWEYEMVLTKILCGWELEQPIDIQLELESSTMEAAEQLLKDFLALWMPQHAFSTDWLRRNFLQREGKLKQRSDGHWELTIERKTEDVLLRQLPPGIGFSIIKYAWMDQLLFVEW